MEEQVYNVGGMWVTEEGYKNLQEAGSFYRESVAKMMFGKYYKNNPKCRMTEDKCEKTCPYCEQLNEKTLIT